MYRILSLSGGGVKSYLTLEILKELEEKSGKKIYEMFDLVVGTSGGAFIGALLDTLPAWYIEQLFRYTYKNKLFSPNKNSFNGLLKTKYNTEDKIYSIKELLKPKIEFSNFDFAAISYDLSSNKPIIFNTIEEDINSNYALIKDFNIADSVIASSAAPIYWDPYIYKNYTLVDGAFCSNNPTSIGIKLALNKNIKLEDLAVVHIGTGTLTRNYARREGHNLFKWLFPMFNIMMNAPSQVTNMLYSKEELTYYNLDGALINGSDDIDNITPENFDALKLDAHNIIELNQESINKIVQTF